MFRTHAKNFEKPAKIIVSNSAYRNYSAGTGQYGNLPWRSPKGPNNRDLEGTFKGLSGDQH